LGKIQFFRTVIRICGRKRCVNTLPQNWWQPIPSSEGQHVGQERHVDRLAEDYAAAKAESQRIWQLLQAELRAGTPASELTDLEGRMWAAMHRLERASQELYERHSSSGKHPFGKSRRFG
jgi:hypothetical protein